MGLTMLCNPPYAKGSLHKKVFKEMCKHGTVYSLQPHGSCKTHEGYTAKLFPLHTSVKMFGICLMPLEVCTNVKEKSLVDLDKCKFVTVEDGKLNGTIPLKVRRPGVGNDISNTVVIKQPEPLKVSFFNSANMTKVNSGVAVGQTSCNSKNLLWFNTKKERTNFIKNISKIIALQILFSSNIFPQDRDRLLPPLDREYSKDELLDYFNFPKDVYKEFDDIEKEEPNSHYTSFEKWRDYRKEKYGLEWEEE